MKKKIYKYSLGINDKQFIKMPIGAEILHIGTQGTNAFIWALINPNADQEERCFEVFGTGHSIHYDMGVDRKFIGTFQIGQGKFSRRTRNSEDADSGRCLHGFARENRQQNRGFKF